MFSLQAQRIIVRVGGEATASPTDPAPESQCPEAEASAPRLSPTRRHVAPDAARRRADGRRSDANGSDTGKFAKESFRSDNGFKISPGSRPI